MVDQQLYTLELSGRINLVYSTLAGLTCSETDPELIEYYQFLLDTLQETIQYITRNKHNPPMK